MFEEKSYISALPFKNCNESTRSFLVRTRSFDDGTRVLGPIMCEPVPEEPNLKSIVLELENKCNIIGIEEEYNIDADRFDYLGGYLNSGPVEDCKHIYTAGYSIDVSGLEEKTQEKGGSVENKDIWFTEDELIQHFFEERVHPGLLYLYVLFMSS